MSRVYLNCRHILFDWGGTLMVDIPEMIGPMCDWPEVSVVAGAEEGLRSLSTQVSCHLATNAADSNEAQIRQALKRAGLSDFIGQIFCTANLSSNKPAPAYFERIMATLDCPASDVVMVGDALDKDVYGALACGLQAVWFNPGHLEAPTDILTITSLNELVTA